MKGIKNITVLGNSDVRSEGADAHSHDFKDYSFGKSRVICLRALDPDKSIGKPPCITYFEVTDRYMRYYESCFQIPKEKRQSNQIKHQPMFMEMRELKQAIISLKAFEEIQEF